MEPRTPPGPGMAPERQEEMGKDHRIAKKLLGMALPIWGKKSQSRGGRVAAAAAPHCGIKSSFCAGSSPRIALGRCGASQAIPRKSGICCPLPGPRPGLKAELGLVRLLSRGFLEMGGIFWELSGAAGTGEPKSLSIPWDVPGGKGNFHRRSCLGAGKGAFRGPKSLSTPYPGMCPVEKGILVPQNLELPKEGGGVRMMQQPELLQSGIGKLEQQPRLGHGEGGKSLRKRLQLFQRKN